MKKIKALLLVTTLVGSVLLATESSAATKITNGTACSSKQKNKTTKVKIKGGTDTYRCTNSPTASAANKNKLVWVHLDCLEANKLYQDTVAELNGAKANSSTAPADIALYQSTVDSIKSIRSQMCARNY